MSPEVYEKRFLEARAKSRKLRGVPIDETPIVVHAELAEGVNDRVLNWWSGRRTVTDLRHVRPVRENVPPKKPPPPSRTVLAVAALTAVDQAYLRVRGRGLTGKEQLEWCRRIDLELKRMGYY